VLNKFEGRGVHLHGHVTAVTIAPLYRRLGLARGLMHTLERKSEAAGGHFVDLFVRCSNDLARGMYAKLGYHDYRRILDYYGDEDGMELRKALPLGGTDCLSPAKDVISPSELENWGSL
jgi:N-terminal acetyltransferase B complex catalytic subunit